MRKLLAVLGFFVIAGGVLACGAASDNAGKLVSSVPTVAPTAIPKHFGVGQSVQVGDTFNVIVNSVKTSTGDDMFQPKAGNQYLLIDVSIKNVSAKAQSVSSLAQWKLRDSTGLEYTETIADFGTAPDGDIEAGAPIRGIFTYEVPTTTKSFTLAFTPDFMDTGATTWDIAA